MTTPKNSRFHFHLPFRSPPLPQASSAQQLSPASSPTGQEYPNTYACCHTLLSTPRPPTGESQNLNHSVARLIRHTPSFPPPQGLQRPLPSACPPTPSTQDGTPISPIPSPGMPLSPTSTCSPSPSTPSPGRASPNEDMFRNPSANSSSSSVSSLNSIRTVSSNSLLYYVKKPPLELELPFGLEGAEGIDEEVQAWLDGVRDRQKARKRGKWMRGGWKVAWLVSIACVMYFGFAGWPLWDGVVYKIWKYTHSNAKSIWGLAAFLLWGSLLTWLPLLFSTFEHNLDDVESRDVSEICLIIPAYKAATALAETIPHALKIFRPEQVYIIANGPSPTPLDDTADVCERFGVNHVWVPIGSKIVAEFVGVHLARKFKYCLLTDDDVHLPSDLPFPLHRLDGNTKCLGYTIKSTGANGIKGTLIQQAQDVEYKLSGLSKVFQAKYGSAVFPHGAVILWDRNVLEKLFWGHPGYHISEDWYFGHTCRSAGFRIDFCSQVFVETETPPRLFVPVKSARGGYGEMTVWKQRFYRWDFFFLYRLVNDVPYLLFAWRLGWRELATKIYVFAEVYGTMTYVARPIVFPIMLAASWQTTLASTSALLAVYVLGFVVFNSVHLRRKGESVSWKILPVYFGMKMALVVVDTLSVWWAAFEYARFFSQTHLRVPERFEALHVVRELERERREKEKRIGEDVALQLPKEEIVTSGGIQRRDEGNGVLFQEGTMVRIRENDADIVE